MAMPGHVLMRTALLTTCPPSMSTSASRVSADAPGALDMCCNPSLELREGRNDPVRLQTAVLLRSTQVHIRCSRNASRMNTLRTGWSHLLQGS
ncbi:hypothetical protein PsYK624_114460 [Phanerochaete sordida]|uniref:Uncharacterized protein n=1 Tax=Phanerochaete sordida TaxID=48140 RepID=A0A9P3LHR5_9APHY|nr:hypothetical protein PsYK624_114460 [Phanerochaete sordida]